MPVLQFLYVTALGLLVAWGVHKWLGLFDNYYLGGAILAAMMVAYAVIYDRRQAKRQRDMPDSQ